MNGATNGTNWGPPLSQPRPQGGQQPQSTRPLAAPPVDQWLYPGANGAGGMGGMPLGVGENGSGGRGNVYGTQGGPQPQAHQQAPFYSSPNAYGTIPIPPNPPQQPPDNIAKLYDLFQQGILTRAQFDTLVATSTPAAPSQPPQHFSPPNQPSPSSSSLSASTQLPPHLASPVPPTLPHGSASAFYSSNPSSSPFQQTRPAYPPQSQAPAAFPQGPPGQARPPSGASSAGNGSNGGTASNGHIPAQALLVHLATMDHIHQLQRRITQLQTSLTSGTAPASLNSMGGQPMSPEQKEQVEKELGDLKTRQTALVNQCQRFVQANGGQQRVAQEIRALNSGQGPGGGNGGPGGQPQPNFAPHQTPAPYGSGNPSFPPSFAFSAPSFSTSSPGPQYPPTQSSPAFPYANQPGFYSQPPPSTTLPPTQPHRTPTPQPPPPLTPSTSTLSIGLQASLAARAAQPARPTPPVSRPSTTSMPTFHPTTSPASTSGGSPPVTGGTRPVAGLPKGTTNANRSATAILAEGSPGMPTLAQLQQQLKPEAFATSLRTVMGKRGVEIRESYYLENIKVPLYELYQTVMVDGGGVEQVDATRSWLKIAKKINLPDHPSFVDGLARLYHDVLATYEDVWSTALLKQREKMAAQSRSRSGSSNGSREGGGGDAPRSMPNTGLKFSERFPGSSSTTPHFDPHASSSFDPNHGVPSTANHGSDGTNPWNDLRATPTSDKQGAARPVAPGHRGIDRPRGVAGPLSSPYAAQAVVTSGLAALFGHSGSTPASDSGRFEEISEPASKKGRNESLGSTTNSPAGSADSPHSTSSQRERPSPQEVPRADSRAGNRPPPPPQQQQQQQPQQPQQQPQQQQPNPRPKPGSGKKRARDDDGAGPSNSNAPPPAGIDRLVQSYYSESTQSQFGAPGQNPNHEPVAPSFPPPGASSFDFGAAWPGGPSSMPYGASSFGQGGSGFDFDLGGQFIPNASSPGGDQTPDLVSSGLPDNSPPSDDGGPHLRQQPSGSRIDIVATWESADSPLSFAGGTPTAGGMSPFDAFEALSGGVGDTWDPNYPDKWKIPQTFDFTDEFQWTT